MKRRFHIQPRFVVAATVAVAVLMIGTGFIELRQSRNELYHLMGESALALAETIDRSGANNLLSTEVMEDLLAERLLDNARHIARLDSARMLDRSGLAALAAEHGLYRVNVFDKRGRRILSNHIQSAAHANAPEKYSPVDVLAPILRGDADYLVIGLKEARVEEGQRFAVAVRRTHSDGGAIVVNLDAADLLSFRRTIGIGRLLTDLGNNSGIAYVAIQDTLGILAAGGVVELSSIDADSVVSQALSRDTTIMRVFPFGDTDVFEVVRPFAPAGAAIGVLRIGLSMDEVHSAEARMLRRTIIMSFVALLIGTLAFVFLWAQQNQQLMEKRYQSIRTYTGNILAQMRDGVVTADPSGTVTMCNARAAEILGLRADMIEGRTIHEFQEGATGVLKEIFGNQDGSTERIVAIPGGGEHTVQISLSTIMDAGGGVESRSAILRDVTEARRLEREVQRTSKLTAMGELASGVAHEIRNPLNAIGMIAQRLAKEFTPRRGAREYHSLAAVMQEETRRVNTIIQQFLAFARPPRLNRRLVPVRELLDRVGSLFSSQARAKEVGFVVSGAGSGTALLDHEQMQQALLNLLQNALDATPAGGQITLSADISKDGVRIVVADNGIGMSPASLERIFDLYYTTKPHGTGLGLSITQQIIGQHGGTIEVSSGEGRGTTFTLHLPDERVAETGADESRRSASGMQADWKKA